MDDPVITRGGAITIYHSSEIIGFGLGGVITIVFMFLLVPFVDIDPENGLHRFLLMGTPWFLWIGLGYYIQSFLLERAVSRLGD